LAVSQNFFGESLIPRPNSNRRCWDCQRLSPSTARDELCRFCCPAITKWFEPRQRFVAGIARRRSAISHRLGCL